jgi:hypothetical protein
LCQMMSPLILIMMMSPLGLIIVSVWVFVVE